MTWPRSPAQRGQKLLCTTRRNERSLRINNSAALTSLRSALAMFELLLETKTKHLVSSQVRTRSPAAKEVAEKAFSRGEAILVRDHSLTPRLTLQDELYVRSLAVIWRRNQRLLLHLGASVLLDLRSSWTSKTKKQQSSCATKVEATEPFDFKSRISSLQCGASCNGNVALVIICICSLHFPNFKMHKWRQRYLESQTKVACMTRWVYHRQRCCR